MASTPDPWLYCLLAEATRPEHASSLKQKFVGLQLVADKRDRSGEDIAEGFPPFLGAPIIWMVPIGRRKVVFLHSFEEATDPNGDFIK